MSPPPIPRVEGHPMSRRPFVSLIGLLAWSGYSVLTLAQAPPRPASRPVSQADRLPVRRVVLYKSGVGDISSISDASAVTRP
jgi:hypothetical protein